ncbi:MAG: chromate resistance protein [Hyphomicrobiales bacterium]|nr:chromate resistance protein [Hyphomicrobiales bacterium]
MKRRSQIEKTVSCVPAPWLLLMHQLPPKPAYLRVKIWRRLQGLGAISVKNSVYVLPTGEQRLEDFQWLLREIEQGGGEGIICEANLVDGLSDQDVRGLFDAARDADYAEIAKELRALAAKVNDNAEGESKAEAKATLARLRRRFTELSEIDFFGATGRLTVDGLFVAIEEKLVETINDEDPEDSKVRTIAEDLAGKTWVTRSGVHVDRIACAWLIRRFIDPQAQFKFVSAKDYLARPGELRFDMFQGEFTHEGDKCSFEVLLERLGLKDAGLRAIAEIVHDIDLKDGKFGRDETAGIAVVISGICAAQKDDLARVERGAAVFSDTYESFRKKRDKH